ncbi:transposase [Paenibacillus sp. EKM208P]|nr:transposase [Paenibacillus sp. EKM208P]
MGAGHGRCHHRPRPSTWSGRKRGQDRQAIGRSRGGLTTKIHAMVDALGYPLRFELTPGQDHDSVTGYRLLHELDFCPGEVLADRAYDTNAILELLQSRAITPVIPSKRNRRVKRPLDSSDRTTLKPSCYTVFFIHVHKTRILYICL